MTKFCIFLCIFLTFMLATTMSEALDCKTISGPEANKPCEFPFTSQGITYHACTTDQNAPGDDNAWCSTMIDDAGLHVQGKWGNCEAKCPVSSTLIFFLNSGV